MLDAAGMKVFDEADRLVTSSTATQAEIDAAIARVDALGDEEASGQIRQSAGEWRAMARDYDEAGPAPQPAAAAPTEDPFARLARLRASKPKP